MFVTAKIVSSYPALSYWASCISCTIHVCSFEHLVSIKRCDIGIESLAYVLRYRPVLLSLFYKLYDTVRHVLLSLLYKLSDTGLSYSVACISCTIKACHFERFVSIKRCDTWLFYWASCISFLLGLLHQLSDIGLSFWASSICWPTQGYLIKPLINLLYRLSDNWSVILNLFLLFYWSFICYVFWSRGERKHLFCISI